MRRAHAWSGAFWLLVFLATGAYMRFHQVDQMTDVTRAIYRSRHLFVLGGASANLALSTSHARHLFISVLVLIAPVFLVAAFFTDPEAGIHSGAPWLSLGQYSLFAAAALLAVRHFRSHP